MSTIFGHGRLRLYLLKMLDESPRHGYEIISLLRDRFLGVYSPSPGTIYPRLARLEEEGLVTHEEVNERKVYRLTDKGREELRNRSSDLDDLEQEITDSVRDVARAVKEDVRDTISSLREELKFSSGGARRSAQREKSSGSGDRKRSGEAAGASESDEREQREGAFGSCWERDWEKLAQGLGGAWGGSRSRRERGAERSDFEQALRDFSERVRGIVREAGHVGESATHDVRRVLDDTIEVIRRDLAKWGPPEQATREQEEQEKTSRAQKADAEGRNSTTVTPETSETTENAATDSGTSAIDDPWTTAIREEQEDSESGGGADTGSGFDERR